MESENGHAKLDTCKIHNGQNFTIPNSGSFSHDKSILKINDTCSKQGRLSCYDKLVSTTATVHKCAFAI